MEKEIQRHYRQANKEISQKWNAYMERADKRLRKRENALKSALRTKDDELIREAQNALIDAKKAITFNDARYATMVKETADRIYDANKTALEYVNGKSSSIYALNYNQAKVNADEVGVHFNLIDENVVKRRIIEGDIALPKPKKLGKVRDVHWNTKQMNSAVLQGILQGEDMRKISKRLLPIVENNKKSAIRNARTLVTQAENSGRLDSFRELQNLGCELMKVWMATSDGRTRDIHVDMDGQTVPVEEPFDDTVSAGGLMYPADPSGDPSSVYNCRCCMITEIKSVNGKAV